MDIFKQKDSIPTDMILKDEDGNIIDLDDLLDIWVGLFHKLTNNTLSTIQLTLGTVIKVDAAAGHCRVITNTSVSEWAEIGIYEVETRTSETDAAYENSIRYRGWTAEAFELKKSRL